MNNLKDTPERTFFIVLKTLAAHIVLQIVGIQLLVSSSLFVESNSLSGMVVFGILLGAYFYSGYWMTSKKALWYQYTAIAGLGIALWLICYSGSPDAMGANSADRKGGIWALYQMYIIALAAPLEKVANPLFRWYNTPKSTMFGLGILCLLPSLMQYFGAVLKNKKSNNYNL